MLDETILRNWLHEFTITILKIGSNKKMSISDQANTITLGQDILCKLIMSNLENNRTLPSFSNN